MNCAQCREAIQGNFLRVGRLAFHPEHFLCKACNLPIKGNYNTHQGACFHPSCWAEAHAPRCAHCAKALTGKYLVIQGKNVHEGCYRPFMEAHGPRCAQCGEGMAGKMVELEGKRYHAECYAKHHAVNCIVCRQGIVGTSLKDYWGNIYHAQHAREFATCLYCAKLLHPHVAGGGGGLVYADGRPICRGCHRTAVHRDGDAQRVVAAVRNRMQGWGIDIGGIDVPVKTVDRTRLAQLLTRGPHEKVKRVSGFAHMNWERHGREARNKQATVYLLTGMPLAWLEATAAHELMHVWNFHHGPGHSFALEEGSCNYMSYRMHVEQANDMTDYHIDCLMQDPDPAYGVGFRKVKKYVDRHGFGRLLTMLKSSKDFPILEGIF